MSSYYVKVPLVIARDTEGKDRYLYRGAIVPSDVPPAEVQRLVDGEFLGQVGGEPATTPARSAVKADWVAFAVAQGMDKADAEKLKKEELLAKYGDAGDSVELAGVPSVDPVEEPAVDQPPAQVPTG